MDFPKIDSGIYRHFKGKLYFVLGLAWSRNDPINPKKAEVTYHPLYLVENMGWRNDISLEEFLGITTSQEFNHSGPRFAKIRDWVLPNIIPGSSFSYRAHKYIIESLRFNDDDQDIEILMKRRIFGGEWVSGIVESIQWLESRLESR